MRWILGLGLAGAAAWWLFRPRTASAMTPTTADPAAIPFNEGLARADALLETLQYHRDALDGAMVDDTRLATVELYLTEARQIRLLILGDERVSPETGERLIALERASAELLGQR